MLYTIGRTLKYEREFAERPVVVKGGRQPDGYLGGFVWQTRAAAQDFLISRGLKGTHRVYGVIADWDADTYIFGSGRYLIRDAQIMRL